MKQVNVDHIESLINEIKSEITNARIEELFTSRPKIELEVYKKTAIFSALKQYEENIESQPIVPHGFYAILEEELERNGLLTTIKKYKVEIDLIAKIMHMDTNHIINLLKELKKPNHVDIQQQLNARQELKAILRKFNAKFKEEYIKRLINKKMELLKEFTTLRTTKVRKYILPLNIFEDYIIKNKQVRDTIATIINERLGIIINGIQLQELIRTTLSSDYETETARILNITPPVAYQHYVDTKALNRLKRSYEQTLNILFQTETKEVKELVIDVIKTKIALRQIKDKEQYNKYKKLLDDKVQKLCIKTNRTGLHTIEEISAILVSTNVQFGLNHENEFEFKLSHTLTKEERKQSKEYVAKQIQIKKIHNMLYGLYEKLDKGLASVIQNTDTPVTLNESNYEIDTSHWLTKDKIMSIINKIDTEKLDNLSDEHYKLLKKFLIEDGLLWAYIAENIDLNTFSKIINNFDTIASVFPANKICISQLHEIIKTANMQDYTNDLIIGLVGQEIATKVINYNQFSGVTVTDEVIQKRLRKLIDLSVRSEYINKSSLPFRCNVRLGNYQLQRYRNNDPSIFASGIDTKTCFFISVNENDFFFYSLINKNGFVLKIVNENDELIARASCFRKNNIFMINGIRCKNNKVLPENKEDTEEMFKIVELLELFATKLIERTKDDECPIDYVVCNKAGILENPFFENRFESINSDLFKEPINIYDDDWQEFVHTYDGQEQMLQEVPTCPNKSFTTDFGSHFPALLIKSRNYMPLTSPRHISLKDQPATYTRPKRDVEEYIGLEITDEILARINRIKALSCFIGTPEEQLEKQRTFKLLTKSDIKSIELAEDWYALLKSDDTFEVVRAKNENRQIQNVTILKKA